MGGGWDFVKRVKQWATEDNRCITEPSGFDRREGMTAALAVEARSLHHLQNKLGARMNEARGCEDKVVMWMELAGEYGERVMAKIERNQVSLETLLINSVDLKVIKQPHIAHRPDLTSYTWFLLWLEYKIFSFYSQLLWRPQVLHIHYIHCSLDLKSIWAFIHYCYSRMVTSRPFKIASLWIILIIKI